MSSKITTLVAIILFGSFYSQVSGQKTEIEPFNLQFHSKPLFKMPSWAKTYTSKTTTLSPISASCPMYIGTIKKTDNIFTQSANSKRYTWDWSWTENENNKNNLKIPGLTSVENNGDIIIDLSVGNIKILDRTNNQIKNSENIAIDHYITIKYTYSAILTIKDKNGKVILSEVLQDNTVPKSDDYPEGSMYIRDKERDGRASSECALLSSKITENTYPQASKILLDCNDKKVNYLINIYTVTSKNQDYSDINKLFYELKSGLVEYNDSKFNTAEAIINPVVQKLIDIDKQFEPENKKARINNEVHGIISYMISVGTIVTNQYDLAKKYSAQIEGFKKDEQLKLFINQWLIDAEKRHKINL